MQSVPLNWYQRLNYVLGVGLLLLGALYIFLRYTDIVGIAPAVFGLNIYAAMAAGAGALYSFVGFQFLKRDYTMQASVGTLLFATVTMGSIIFISGDFQSPLYFLWLILVFVTGMFGAILPSVYFILTVIYLVMLLSDAVESTTTLESGLIMIVANLAASALGYVFWRQHFVDKNTSRVNTLTSKLEAEQLRSEVLINSIADGVVAVDVNGKIQLFNPAAEKMSGWTFKDARNIDVETVIKLSRVEKEKVRELTGKEHPFLDAVAGNKQIHDESTQLTARDDSEYELSLSVSPIILQEEVQGAVGVFRDVSEQRRQERQRAEFISTASHEMRTPVAAIEGYLSLAMNDRVAKIDSKARGYLEKAYESTKHLGQLFKDLLTAAKSEDGRLSSNPQVVEINEFLEKVTEDVRFTAEEKGLSLEYAVLSEGENKAGSAVINPLYYVHVDPERMREVITNLLTNAIKFTEEGGITIGLRSAGEYVQISIRDTGYGIPKDDIPHLFQKFYRVDNSATRTIGGTGLGLFISRNIVEMYKGRIWVESEAGKGSTFYINLPRLDSDRAKDLLKQEEAQTGPLQTE